MRKFLQRWKEQQSNKGSSLVMVVSIVAIVGILAFSLLTISLITYKMKATNMNSKKNFYDAEKVMDDISLGLQEDISKAAGEAYAWTLTNFSANGATEDVRRSNYVNKFHEELLSLIRDTSGTSSYAIYYKLDHLKDMVSPEAKADANSLTITAAGNLNIINQDTSAGTYTLKNLQVTYTDKKNYTTQIQTDIVLSCPQLAFDQNSTVPLDLTTYALVANDQTTTAGTNVNIKGSAYLGNKGAEVSPGTSITFENPTDTSASRIITAGNVEVKQGGNLMVNSRYQLWARSLILDGSTANVSGQTYLNNDIVLDTLKSASDYISSDLTMSGSLFAYGNPKTADSAEIYRDVYTSNKTTYETRFQKASEAFFSDGILSESSSDKSLLQTKEADFSSAILINGRKASVDFSGLSEMVIAGNAYVGASLKDSSSTGISNEDVKMGESLSLKSNQRAYLVPAEFIAPYCDNGGRNPMTQKTYTDLNTEMAQKLGVSEDDLTLMDYVKADASAVPAIPDKLAKLGVVNIRRAVYKVSPLDPDQNMIYFFLVFNNEESANTFAQSYWAEDKNLSSLRAHIYPDYNDLISTNPSVVSTKYPDGVLENPENYNVYFNGGVVLASEPNQKDLSKFYPGTLSQSNKYPNLTQDEINYQQTFAALRHKLTVDFSGLTEQESKQTIYQNIVVPDMTNLPTNTSEHPKAGLSTSETQRVFKQDGDASTKMCAVVVNGDYSVPASGEEGGYPIHVIIAKGDVTVPEGCTYTGLLIAGGKVTLNLNANLTADSSLAQQALRITESATGTSTCAADFLINGSMYLIGDNGSSSEDSDEIQFSDYISYSNWTKQ